MGFTDSIGGIRLTGAVQDTNSPLSAATGNPPTGNPFTIPSGAIGMIVSPGHAMVAGDAGEISQEITEVKGTGVVIRGTDPLQYFSISGDENFHLNWVAGTATFLLNVAYVF